MSKHFFANGEEIEKEESINKYFYLFLDYKNNIPTLEEALVHMFISSGLPEKKAYKFQSEIINDSKIIIKQNFEKIKVKYPLLSFEDAQIISSYTCELEGKDNNYSPYKILNTSLVSQNRKDGIKKISKYFFILLSALRKLPKYYPDEKAKFLYRCIKTKVNQKYDPFRPEFIPYIRDPNNPDKIKTFWGFTSTSPRIDLALTFLNDKKKVEKEILKSGTIFTLTGKVWGYDITLFNFYKEKEILLEPERKYKIDEALPEINDIIRIRCEILDTDIVLPDITTKFDNNKQLIQKMHINKSIEESYINPYYFQHQTNIINLPQKHNCLDFLGRALSLMELLLINNYYDIKRLFSYYDYNDYNNKPFKKEQIKEQLYINLMNYKLSKEKYFQKYGKDFHPDHPSISELIKIVKKWEEMVIDDEEKHLCMEIIDFISG